MKLVKLLISLVITLAVIILLSTAFSKTPPFGEFFSPQHGFWQNAEPAGNGISRNVSMPGLSHAAEVYFDERLVPHVFANDAHDASFVQGYLHAKFRLWQMEFQTYAAAGRLSEILGPGPDSAYLNNDRSMRRLGMVYGARRSLSEIMKDEQTRMEINAYTEGINSYISTLTTASLPLEYRLLNYEPEKWTNLKTALLLMYLSFDLTGSGSDIEYTNAKSFFSEEDFHKLYPLVSDSSDPVIPKGTVFPPASVNTDVPSYADSLYFQWKRPSNVQSIKTDKDNGSNNWAASGSKTKSGRPILCNDPHLHRCGMKCRSPHLNTACMESACRAHLPLLSGSTIQLPGELPMPRVMCSIITACVSTPIIKHSIGSMANGGRRRYKSSPI